MYVLTLCQLFLSVQALVLLAFNPTDVPVPTPSSSSAPPGQPPVPPTPRGKKLLSVQALCQATGMERPMLMQTLQSLAAGKYKVLKRDTHGTVQHYYVNDSMKSKLVRIVLHTYQGRLTKKDVEVQLWWMMLVV